MAWAPAPDGEAIALAQGQSLAVVASVKRSHAAADLAAFARTRGLTLTDYAEEGQRLGLGPDPDAPDYRYVAAVARASRPVMLPWSAPWPVSMLDGSTLVHAWRSLPGSAPSPPPAPGPPVALRPPRMPMSVVVFLYAMAGLAVWGEHRRRRARKSRR